MANTDAYTTPAHVIAIEGEVVQCGPDGKAVSMTPDAAEGTGTRLIEAAAEARGQARPMLDAEKPRPR